MFRKSIPLLLAALVAACSPGDTGATCAEDADCEPGATCNQGREAGYCAAPCEQEGTAAGCPADTLCKAIQGGAMRCLLVCEQQADCPAGSNCTGLSSGSAKVCEPQP